MALSANVFNTSSTQQARPRKVYPFVEGQVIGQLVSVKEAEQKTFDDRHLPWDQAQKEKVIRFTFIVLRADKKEKKGHGRPVTLQVRQPRTVQKPEPGRNASNLYKVLCRLLNGGRDLTDDQLRNITALVNDLEQERPQYYLFLEGNPDNGFVKVSKVVSRVPEDEELPEYRDSRLDDDDPDIVCSVTGEPINGWEKSDGTWVSNEAWRDIQLEKLGTDAVYTFEERPGEYFAPPFGPKFYRRAREQREAMGQDDLPF